ncbi:MAG TPA: hypothetical protein VGV93_00365 [Acidimicrobiales bacterium]|nr:hypothetical protein [Acidimicrobiales bacterium]
MDLALLFVAAQSDAPNQISPELNEAVWGAVSVGLMLAPVVLALLLARYLVATRRAAESAASESAALRRELRHRGN